MKAVATLMIIACCTYLTGCPRPHPAGLPAPTNVEAKQEPNQVMQVDISWTSSAKHFKVEFQNVDTDGNPVAPARLGVYNASPAIDNTTAPFVWTRYRVFASGGGDDWGDASDWTDWVYRGDHVNGPKPTAQVVNQPKK